MKLVRFAFLVLVTLTIASVAEAQCLKCYPEPGRPFSAQGTCGYHWEGDWCTRQCCDMFEGWGCSVVDFMDPCDQWPPDWRVSSVIERKPKPARTRPERAFTSRLVPDSNSFATQRLRTCRS